MISLSRSLVSRIHAHLARDYPLEGCGLLYGRREADRDVVLWFAGIRRPADATSASMVRQDPDWFEIDPQAQLWVDTDARKAGLTQLGIVHSHPDHPARPSPRDLERAWPALTYLICSVRGGAAAEWTCWTLQESPRAFLPVVVELLGDDVPGALPPSLYERREPRPLV